MMSSRPIVSYDDITLPYDASSQKSQPPPKKRKRNNNNNNNNKKAPPPPAEEGRELTHEEIWDDSALIDAWNAAMEEYEAFNGPDKGWQKEPVHKSPLWYNVPPKNTSSKLPAVDKAQETDSQPINFDTFVPTHDPSLSAAAIQDAQEDSTYTHLPGVSQDEAFERAVQASYWSGYWTAVYHTLSQNKTINTEAEAEENDEDIKDDDEDEDYDENGDSEEFVSTQR